MARTPRFDPYKRLIYRFYEAICLLYLLGNIRGPHVATIFDPSSLIAVRRRFLKNLAFLCDDIKGGDSTASIAVQDCPDCYVFWISSNKGPSDRTLVFLRSVLEHVKAFVRSTQADRQTVELDLTRKCVLFSLKRMRCQVHSLVNCARRCIDHLLENPANKRGENFLSQGAAFKSLTSIQVSLWLSGCSSSKTSSSRNRAYIRPARRHTGSEMTRKCW